MEAKDTVMGDGEILRAIEEGYEVVDGIETRVIHAKSIAKVQAEISFPAGEKQGLQKGIREVVEWIKENASKVICHNQPDFPEDYIDIGRLGIKDTEWQAKLKEWAMD